MDKILKAGRRGVHLSNNPVLPAHATTAPPQTVAEKASAVCMKSALRKLPAMKGRGKARGGGAGRGGGRGGKRMYNCSVCGKPGTRKGHAPLKHVRSFFRILRSSLLFFRDKGSKYYNGSVSQVLLEIRARTLLLLNSRADSL